MHLGVGINSWHRQEDEHTGYVIDGRKTRRAYARLEKSLMKLEIKGASNTGLFHSQVTYQILKLNRDKGEIKTQAKNTKTQSRICVSLYCQRDNDQNLRRSEARTQ